MTSSDATPHPSADRPRPGGRLEVSEEGAALVVRISSEKRANALDEGVLEGLVSVLESARTQAAACVLLGGAGSRHFSSGVDLAERDEVALPAALREGERLLGRAARAVSECARPVVAVLNGAAYGGALELAAACDWRIARRGAALAMPAARLGVVYTPDGLRRFVALLGPARTRRLFLTGRPLDADEALALGLVDQVEEPEGLWAAALAAAADVAAAAPLAVAGTRAIVRALVEDPHERRVGEIADAWRERAFASRDFREGLRAFRARAAPRFEGR